MVNSLPKHKVPMTAFKARPQLQSSQVDLLAKSEICKGAAVVCDAAGVWGHAPPGNFEK